MFSKFEDSFVKYTVLLLGLLFILGLGGLTLFQVIAYYFPVFAATLPHWVYVGGIALWPVLSIILTILWSNSKFFNRWFW